MTVVAFIPARGGSKSIPLKNIKPIAGRPLIQWTVAAAIACPGVDRVVVATDDGRIAEAARAAGPVEVRGRAPETATDGASTESAMLEFARADAGFEVMVLIQATSPLLTADDLAAGLERFRETGADSLLSVVRQKRFLWAEQDGGARPLNYDPALRPRRQEFEGFLVENGAFYVCRRDGLLRTGSRLHGRIALAEMAEESYVELDEPADWAAVETLLLERRRSGLAERLGRIRLVLSDVDGVLTDAGMYYGESGEELKKFNTRDGMGFERLRAAGITVGLLTSERTQLVERRGAKLRMDVLVQGAKDKLAETEAILARLGFDWPDLAYVGDDVNDREVLARAGFAAVPADAAEAVRTLAHHVCARRGGEGCLREVAELILAVRGAG